MLQIAYINVGKIARNACKAHSVIPAVEASKWRRILARIKQLDELAKRVKALERKQ